MRSVAPLWLALCLLILGSSPASAASPGRANPRRSNAVEAEWIWAPERAGGPAEAEVCFFRRVFDVRDPVRGRITIACDDRYDLFVNGRKVGAGREWNVLDSYDIASYLVQGRNAIAVRAENDKGDSAGLVARVVVQTAGGTDVSYSTDATWLASVKEESNWQRALFNDTRWAAAPSLGEFGVTAPWADQVKAGNGGQPGRFTLPREFRVERTAHPDDTGSLVAMTFNEWGQIVAAREAGPVLLIKDSDENGSPDDVSVFSEQMKGCQGLLSLNGHVFAVGDGPEGAGLYRLTDADQNGEADDVSLLFKFKGSMGEHGPHAVTLGPDGMIYVMIGNHAGVETTPLPSSPVKHIYEGDLVQPRYEDAGGHGVGIKAPGGCVVRTDIEGTFVELYASGLRNPYNLAFNRQGELFTFDSDMEWDIGLPWYRPCRINHLVPGGEYGWRSGWAKWPDYYIDSLPSTKDIGRGSPTGVEFYNHDRFPAGYRNALFACDWSQGRILALFLTPAGGSFTCRGEIFLQGQPLNVTDIAVGPDGWLYFCTGGRGTEGGVYRVLHDGKIAQDDPNGIMQAIRHPQLYSAFSRERIATIKEELGAQWDAELLDIAQDASATTEDRVRVLDLMQLFGPSPEPDLLVKLSSDAAPEVRAKTADLMGLHTNEVARNRLVEMLRDKDPAVRRKACESLVRSGCQPPPEKLLPLLADDERFVSFAARRALESLPAEGWRDSVLESNDARVFLEGATALLVAGPEEATVRAVLARAGELMTGFMPDAVFLDLLRVIQLALDRGRISPDDVPQLREQLAEEYPSLEPRINRELVRLFVYLQAQSVTERFVEELRGKGTLVEKLHLAAYCRFLKTDWTFEQRFELLRFYETARMAPGGHSYPLYLTNFAHDYVATFSAEDRQKILDNALRLPTAGLGALAHLPENPDADLLIRLTQLDRQLKALDTDAGRQLQVGIEAVLGESRDPDGMAYLREVFETRPERRQTVAMALAQEPGGENWPLLIRSLPVLEGVAAQEVLSQLQQADLAPESPETLRQTILCGLRLGEPNGRAAIALLEKWTGEKHSQPNDPWPTAISAWQNWFVETWPDQPQPLLPEELADGRWGQEELLAHLTGSGAAAGDVARGRAVFEKAQCVKCHRHGNRGEGLGPDLSTVGKRFQTKEILESVLYPSQAISDQYASKTVTTMDGFTYMGIVAPDGADSIVILQSNGEKQVVAEADVEDILPNKKSSMPEGLFNNLTLEEIADLFAFLRSTP